MDRYSKKPSGICSMCEATLRLEKSGVALDYLNKEKWPEGDPCITLHDYAEAGGQQYLVSTVFLHVDHSFGLSGPPLWYETMIFKCRRAPEEGGNFKDDIDASGIYQWRYETKAQAKAAQEKIVADIKRGVLPEGCYDDAEN